MVLVGVRLRWLGGGLVCRPADLRCPSAAQRREGVRSVSAFNTTGCCSGSCRSRLLVCDGSPGISTIVQGSREGIVTVTISRSE